MQKIKDIIEKRLEVLKFNLRCQKELLPYARDNVTALDDIKYTAGGIQALEYILNKIDSLKEKESLEDAQGTPINNGDILQCYHALLGSGSDILIVRQDNKKVRFINKEELPELLRNHVIEVIGNVYKNSEILWG